MGLLRSETMKRGTLVVPNDRARAVLYELGSRTRVEFEDQNGHGPRAYKTAVQRIEECERIVRYLVEQIDVHEGKAAIAQNVDELLESRPAYRFEEMEAELKRAYTNLRSAWDNQRSIMEQHARVLEEKYVVHVAMTQMAYDAVDGRQPTRGLLATDATAGISNIAGVVGRQDQLRLSRALFRMSRGNTFTSFHSISDPIPDEQGKPTLRSVFVVYFQGGASSVMSEKVKNICSAYGGRLYAWQTTAADAEARFRELNDQLADSKVSQEAYGRFVQAEMQTLLAPARPNANSLIEDWRCALLIEKSIYSTLNLFESTEHTLKCDCWYAEHDEDAIRRVLIDESPAYGVSAMLLEGQTYLQADPHGHNPPTYIKSSGLSKIMQEVVDTYGTPGYKEANPMLLSIVTFPFIFGVMYGDVGHGLLLLMVGIYMNIMGTRLLAYESAFFGMPLYNLRYLVLMMGFFAFYAGLLYNDFLSMGLNLFPSRYEAGPVEPGAKHQVYHPMFDDKNEGGMGPYPFGLDPAWHGSTNQLLFVNSMKMKIAVLLGVLQMLAGTMLSFTNAVHGRSMIDLFFVCMPQLVFMVGFFGYMDWMILYKWTRVTKAPSIINSMIGMGLAQPIAEKDVLYEGQEQTQTHLLMVLLFCVPWMLIPKPAILYWQHKQSLAYAPVDQDEGGGRGGGHGKARHQIDMGEVTIHQVIETIEFVLGSISHTASYLRLWALSLAHQQLSLVFLQYIMFAGITAGCKFGEGMMGAIVCPLLIFFAMGMFICVSLAILMGMDLIECFLHTLRLHWIEFQSKFFKGDGHAFQPYTHQRILDANNA